MKKKNCPNGIVATAWNNGKHHKSGAGYGIRISPKDRNNHFKKCWKTATIILPKNKSVIVNVQKKSFWAPSCRELISKEIGAWFIKNKKAPWCHRCPPKFYLVQKGRSSSFDLTKIR